MKIIRTLARLLVLTGIAVGIIMIMGKNKNTFTSEGYIGQSDIVIEDGKMTPEALLAFGRLSDPQVSPDGTAAHQIRKEHLKCKMDQQRQGHRIQYGWPDLDCKH